MDVYLLEETKIQRMNEVTTNSLWGEKEVQWIGKNARGRSGGLFILWKSDFFRLCLVFMRKVLWVLISYGRESYILL